MRLKVTYYRVEAVFLQEGGVWRQRHNREEEEDVKEAEKIATFLLMVLRSQFANVLPLTLGSRSVGQLISVVF